MMRLANYLGRPWHGSSSQEGQLKLCIKAQLVKHMRQTMVMSESEAKRCSMLLHQSSWREAIAELIDMPWVSQHFKSSKRKEITSHDLLHAILGPSGLLFALCATVTST
jgi:hypothetical protein